MTYHRTKKMDNESLETHDEIGEQPHAHAKTPSWFTQEPIELQEEPLHEKYSPEATTSQPYFETPNAQAYEKYRKRMEQRFREGQEIYDRPVLAQTPHLRGPQERRPTLPLHEIQGRKKLYALEEEGYKRERNPQKPFPWWRTLGLSTAAVCIGTVAGLGFSNTDLVAQKYNATVASFKQQFAAYTQAPMPKVATASANQTVINKKIITSASLDVNDVQGTFGSMIPLMLNAQSSDASEPITLNITGLPPNAYLTAGVQTTQGSWKLKQNEIPDVKLVVPESAVKRFDMEVAAVEDHTGALAAPIKELTVQLQDAGPQAIAVTQASSGKVNAETDVVSIASPVNVSPASAAPETAVEKPNLPGVIPATVSEADDLVTKGDALLQSGDIVSARQFYLRASELGNAKGSFGVARSYDPKVFAQLNVVGLQPDAAQAADWYQKAAQAGVVAAQQ